MDWLTVVASLQKNGGSETGKSSAGLAVNHSLLVFGEVGDANNAPGSTVL